MNCRDASCVFRFMDWSSRFAAREFLLGILSPWLCAFLAMRFLPWHVACGLLETIGFVGLLFAAALPFCAKSWREAFEEAFERHGRKLAPWHLRVLTVANCMGLAIFLASMNLPCAAFGLAILAVEDAAFFSWIAVFRGGRPEIGIAD